MTNPFAPPPEKDVGLAPFRWGLVVFIVVNIALHFPICRFNFTSGFTCDETPRFWVTAAVVEIFFLLILLRHRGSTGRRFAVGFIGGLIGLSILTEGELTTAWASPVRRLALDTKPSRGYFSHWNETRKERKVWATRMRKREPRLQAATELATRVQRCATLNGRAPDDPSVELITEREIRHCSDLWKNSASAEKVWFPDRYKLPKYFGPEDPPGQMAKVWDEGWRWSYEAQQPAAAKPVERFRITVTPDEALSSEWPQVVTDEGGYVSLVSGPGKPLLRVSPVPDLVRLHECLRGIPAELARLDAEGVSYDGWALRQMTEVLCPDIAPRLGLSHGKRDMVFYLKLPAGTNGSLVRVAEYSVLMTVDEALPTFDFTLSAISDSGIRSYLVTPDGAVHVTTEERRVTADDPLVDQCEMTIDSTCRS